MPRDAMVIWVCPNCGSYYGSSTTPNLHETWNESRGVKTFRRSRCPTKACADEDIHRVPMIVKVVGDAVLR